MLHSWSIFFKDELKENQEKIPLEYPKSTGSDNRTVGMMTIMFDDWSMNGSSPLKFCVETPKWRKIQGIMGLGDYGGKFKPSEIIRGIEKINDLVAANGIETGDVASVYADVTGVDKAKKVLESLKKISEVAEAAGTDIRVINAQVI